MDTTALVTNTLIAENAGIVDRNRALTLGALGSVIGGPLSYVATFFIAKKEADDAAAQAATPATATVPEVVGRDVTAAFGAIQQANLTPVIEGFVVDRQDPAGGAQVSEGSNVKVTAKPSGSGGTSVALPDQRPPTT